MSLFGDILGGVGSFFSSGVGSILGSIGSGLIGAQSTADLNQQQMDFANQQRSTAYQTASQDMQKAGLNPAMMFGSGGPAPMAGVQFQNPAKVGLDAMQSTLSTATQARVADSTINNLVQQNANLKAQAGLTAADTALRTQQGKTELHRTSEEIERARLAHELVPTASNAALTASNQQSMNPTVRRLLDIAGFSGKSLDDILSPIINSAKTGATLGGL